MRYKLFEKFEDRYLLQDMQTMEVVFFNKEKYDRIPKNDIIEYSFIGDFTRRKVAGLREGDIVFESAFYDLIYENDKTIKVVVASFEENDKSVIPIYFGEIPMIIKFSSKQQFGGVTLQLIGKPITLEDMFTYCRIDGVDLTYLDTSLVKSMKNTFTSTHINSIDISMLDTSRVTTMQNMFFDCNNLEYINLGDIDLSKVDNLSAMFAETKIHNIDIKIKGNKKKVVLDNMFQGCSILKEVILDLDCKVKSMSHMFEWCESLSECNIKNIDSSEIEDMSYMFYACIGIERLDLSKFNIVKETPMFWLFYNCYSLTTLDIRNMKYLDKGSVFTNCDCLVKLYYDKDLKLTSEGKFFLAKAWELDNTNDVTTTVSYFEKYTGKPVSINDEDKVFNNRKNYIDKINYTAFMDIFTEIVSGTSFTFLEYSNEYARLSKKSFINQYGEEISRVDFVIKHNMIK